MRKMSIPVLCLLALSACQREPDFDERYDAASEKIRDKAEEIDAEIAGAATTGPEGAATDGN